MFKLNDELKRKLNEFLQGFNILNQPVLEVGFNQGYYSCQQYCTGRCSNNCTGRKDSCYGYAKR